MISSVDIVNVSSVIKMKATKEYDDSTVAQILELVEKCRS